MEHYEGFKKEKKTRQLVHVRPVTTILNYKLTNIIRKHSINDKKYDKKTLSQIVIYLQWIYGRKEKYFFWTFSDGFVMEQMHMYIFLLMMDL